MHPALSRSLILLVAILMLHPVAADGRSPRAGVNECIQGATQTRDMALAAAQDAYNAQVEELMGWRRQLLEEASTSGERRQVQQSFMTERTAARTALSDVRRQEQERFRQAVQACRG